MKDSKLTLVGVFTLLLTMGLNFNHSLNDYSIKATKLFAAGTSSSTISTTTTDDDGNMKHCMANVGCSGVWKGIVDNEGCIRIEGLKKCGFLNNTEISFQYSGEKERCCKGIEWYDCEVCQHNCIPSGTNW